MKKLILLLFFTIGFYNIAFTQNENGILKNEWSVNINFFVNELILSKNTEVNIIDYQAPIESIVSYRRYFNKNFVWQVGVNFYSKKSDADFLIGFGENQTQSKKGYYLRTGFQKHHHLSDKVKFYLGTDLLLSFQKYKAFIDFENSGNVFFEGNYTNTNREKEIGLVPHLGFRWELNSRVSFSIESNLIASYVFFDLELDNPFSNDPIIRTENSLNEDSEKFSIRFQEPIVLLINLRF